MQSSLKKSETSDGCAVDSDATVDVAPGAQILVNTDTGGWRNRLASLLRLWAQGLDGRLTLAVEFRTTHPVDSVRLRYCMDRGLECAVTHATEFTAESARLGKRHRETERV